MEDKKREDESDQKEKEENHLFMFLCFLALLFRIIFRLFFSVTKKLQSICHNICVFQGKKSKNERFA